MSTIKTTNPKNPFLNPDVSARYHQFRPWYHSIPAEWLSQKLGDSVNGVLDVACGTGHSTLAMSKFYSRITGLDISPSMLQVARVNSPLKFVE